MFKNVVIVSTNGASYCGFVDFRDNIETAYAKPMFRFQKEKPNFLFREVWRCIETKCLSRLRRVLRGDFFDWGICVFVVKLPKAFPKILLFGENARA